MYFRVLLIRVLVDILETWFGVGWGIVVRVVVYISGFSDDVQVET